MNLKQFFKYFIIHSIVLTVLVFVSFYINEGGDMNTVVFGTLLYIPYIPPYVLVLSGLNLLLIWLGLIKISKRPTVFLTAFFTSIFLTIGLLINGGLITIRYWKLTMEDFLILNIVIILLNLFTIAKLTSNKVETNNNS